MQNTIEEKIAQLAEVDGQLEKIKAQIANYAARYSEQLAKLNEARAEIEAQILPEIKENMFPGKGKSAKFCGYRYGLQKSHDKWVVADEETAIAALRAANCGEAYIRIQERVNLSQINEAPLPDEVAVAAGIKLEKGVNNPYVKRVK